MTASATVLASSSRASLLTRFSPAARFAGVCMIAMFISLGACSKRGTSPWESLKLGTSADLRTVWFEDSQNGWVAGGAFNVVGGLVGRTRDGGKTWRFQSNIVADGGSRGGLLVSSVRFSGLERGIAATGGAGIFVTADGGENWSRATVNGGSGYFSDMMFPGDATGWVAGDQGVWQTGDNGTEWQKIAPQDPQARLGGRAVHFVSNATGWLAGTNGSLMRSDDGGVSWAPVALPLPEQGRPTFWDMHFADARTGWVVGDEGTIFATRDAGATWQRQSTGVADAQSKTKLETVTQSGGKSVTIDAGDRTPGLTLSAVRFADASRGWITGYYPNHGRSLILHTQDGGATWRVEAEIAGEELRALHIQGSNAVWAVGSRTREGPQSIHRRSLGVASK
ncbi:MAG: YCF48-related protein [Burkholderiales bacterium]|nr:YCF48-related protein [Burkholderiales bacterium]